MYTKQESARLRQAFWTAFGQYMTPVPSAGEEKANWLNYKTGIKHLYFKTEADQKRASIAIVLTHPDLQQQQALYDRLLQGKQMLEAETHEAWQWQPFTIDEHGKTISRVYQSLEGVNVFNAADWPAIISFFKPRLQALDAWWQMARYAFE